jgi:hypothetical protein
MRFSLDFLPFALLLAILPITPGRGWLLWLARLLIVLSIAINVWGWYVFTFSPPHT